MMDTLVGATDCKVGAVVGEELGVSVVGATPGVVEVGVSVVGVSVLGVAELREGDREGDWEGAGEGDMLGWPVGARVGRRVGSGEGEDVTRAKLSNNNGQHII
jgi:hypothetical protein